MAWTFVRPVDRSVLAGRPLLDLGTGDGQTMLALTDASGLRVGIDLSLDALRAARRSGVGDVAVASVGALPMRTGSVRTVLAGDVFHHLADDDLVVTLAEVGRVLTPGGVLVAWWYETSGRGGPGDPGFPRPYERVAALASDTGLADVAPLELETLLEPSPPTVGLRATR